MELVGDENPHATRKQRAALIDIAGSLILITLVTLIVIVIVVIVISEACGGADAVVDELLGHVRVYGREGIVEQSHHCGRTAPAIAVVVAAIAVVVAAVAAAAVAAAVAAVVVHLLLVCLEGEGSVRRPGQRDARLLAA